MNSCPIDGARLKSHKHDDLAVAACGQCRGFWLSGSLVTAALKVGHLPTTSSAPRRAPLKRSRWCPTCPASLLDCYRLDDIELDVCKTCSGVWFDAGELERVVRDRAKAPANSPAIARPPAMSGQATPAASRKSSFDFLEAFDVLDLADVLVEALPSIAEMGAEAGKTAAEVIVEALMAIGS
jgi:Zn-finger nucleic acid-binding protein